MAAAAYLFWHVMTSRYRELQAGREYERPVLSFPTGDNLSTVEEQHCLPLDKDVGTCACLATLT